MPREAFAITTFNGLAETAMRLLIILETHHGQGFDLEMIRLLDFFAVFSNDIGGAQSLHPATSSRGAAYNVRKSAIMKALDFLLAAELLTEKNGIYSATHKDDGDPYRSRYLAEIQAAAAWMRGRIQLIGAKAFAAEMKKTALSLAEESLSALPPRDADEVFFTLRDAYQSDIVRLEGLQDACEVFQCLLDVDHKAACNDNGPIIPPFSFFEAVHSKAAKEIVSIQSMHAGLMQMRAENTRPTNLAGH